MTRFFRPNITQDQKDYLLKILDDQISPLHHTDSQFDFIYRLRMKIGDTKEISTSKKADF